MEHRCQYVRNEGCPIATGPTQNPKSVVGIGLSLYNNGWRGEIGSTPIEHGSKQRNEKRKEIETDGEYQYDDGTYDDGVYDDGVYDDVSNE